MTNNAVLLIIDGFGHSEDNPGNAITRTPTPWLDLLKRKFPTTYLNAHGRYVGLDNDRMGNSEVGHLTIGSGRVLETDLVKIRKEISQEKMASRMKKIKADRIHVVGIVSEGGVHGHIDILKSVVRNARAKRVMVHVISDGRDTKPMCIQKDLDELCRFFKEISKGEIVSLSGRFYTMDRDGRHERTKSAYNMMIGVENNLSNEHEDSKINDDFNSVNENIKSDKNTNMHKIYEHITNMYKEGVTDEFIKPRLFDASANILPGEVIIFTNFRADRMRQIVREFESRNICHTMTEYDPEINAKSLFSKVTVKNTLSEIISKKHLTQMHISESEKYAHVTYFFNGGSEKPFQNESRIVVKSKNVATYDLAPKMCTDEVSNKVIASINQKINFIVCNFAAPDMVGHTGKFAETCEAVSACDIAIGRIYEAAVKNNYAFFITSDHGNAEQMIDSNGNICKTHTNNKVPFIACVKDMQIKKGDFSLADVAPTILYYMTKEDIPDEMTGKNMLKQNNS